MLMKKETKIKMDYRGLVTVSELADFTNSSVRTASRIKREICEHFKIPRPRLMWRHVYIYFRFDGQRKIIAI